MSTAPKPPPETLAHKNPSEHSDPWGGSSHHSLDAQLRPPPGPRTPAPWALPGLQPHVHARPPAQTAPTPSPAPAALSVLLPAGPFHQ